MSKIYSVPLKVVVVFHLDTDATINVMPKDEKLNYEIKLDYYKSVLSNSLLARSNDSRRLLDGNTQIIVEGADLKSLWSVFKRYSYQWESFMTNV